jgi:DNA-binding LacI/PurR family transcriptional regulator
MCALQLRGLVPGLDLSVVGFDDIRLASHWHPALTTVSQPFRRLGFVAAQTLIDVVAGKEVDSHVVLEPRLVVRQSTGSPKGADEA